MGEKIHRFNKWCGNNLVSTCKRKKLDPSLMSYAKINSKSIQNLRLKLKLYDAGKETRINLCDLELEYDIKNINNQKNKLIKLGLIKIKML